MLRYDSSKCGGIRGITAGATHRGILTRGTRYTHRSELFSLGGEGGISVSGHYQNELFRDDLPSQALRAPRRSSSGGNCGPSLQEYDGAWGRLKKARICPGGAVTVAGKTVSRILSSLATGSFGLSYDLEMYRVLRACH